MKKILALATILLPFTSFADSTRNTFIGISVPVNSVIESASAVNNNLIGFNAFVGVNPTNDFKFDAELSLSGYPKMGIQRFLPASFMGNMYLRHEFFKGFVPYVGGGIGLGYLGTTELPTKGYVSGMSFAYQVKLGVNFELSDKLDLIMGVKYKDYGNLKIAFGSKNETVVNLYETAVSTGFVYKFAL